jgi:hypothetical protein
MITKHIINTDISYNGINRSELGQLINRWKFLLVTRGASIGDKLALSILSVSVNHIALIFAAAELGMQLLVIDSPVAITTVSKTKMALFGPADFTVECERLKSSELHNLMVRKYSKVVISESEIERVYNPFTEIWASAELPFLIASTSGTTSDSKPVIFTQNEVLQISRRNIDVFKFYKHSRVGHSRNMHHASSLLTDILPSIMASDFHLELYHAHKEFAETVAPVLKAQCIDRILVKNHWNLKEFLSALGEHNPTTILINISGFTVPEYFINLCEKYNVEFLSHFGSVDTGIPILVNHVTAKSEYIENNLGDTVDDFYKIQVQDDQVLVTCDKLWGPEIRKLQDRLTYTERGWLHQGRAKIDQFCHDISQLITGDYTVIQDGANRYLAAWEAIPNIEKAFGYFDVIGYLDKELFTLETKINMDQLRAHFRSIHCTDVKMYSVKLEFSLERNPFALLDRERIQTLINLSNNSGGVSHFYGILLNRHNQKRQYFIIMSYDQESLYQFVQGSGSYLTEMYQILLNSGYQPRLTFNNE